MNKIENPEAVAWALAAEGTISINSYTDKKGRTYYHPHINIGSTDRRFVEEFHKLAGGYGYVAKKSYAVKSYPNCKPKHRWLLNKKQEVLEFLLEVAPYLPIKMTNADVVIEFIRTGRAELVEVIRELNMRGAQG